MAAKVTRLFHIEIVVPDAEATYQFLHKVFGAQKVEEEMASRARVGGCVGFQNGLPFLCVPLGWFFSGKHRLGRRRHAREMAQGGRAWPGEVVRCRGVESKPNKW